MSPILLSLAFLGIGLAIGYLAQRSRMCFVAGLRDWILVRDTELLLGLFAFVATVWVLSSVLGAFGLLHHGMPEYGAAGLAAPGSTVPAAAQSGPAALPGTMPPPGLSAIFGKLFFASLGGGVLLGLISVAVGGCVLRQHVLGAQGDSDALFYLLGFYVVVPLYYLVFARYFDWVYR